MYCTPFHFSTPVDDSYKSGSESKDEFECDELRQIIFWSKVKKVRTNWKEANWKATIFLGVTKLHLPYKNEVILGILNQIYNQLNNPIM